MAVKQTTYRVPPTPDGLKAIENGTLDYLDTDMWNNMNTGILEEYLEEKNKEESFENSSWDWVKVGWGIIIGTVFAVITQYVGLKVGLALSGSWYVVSIIGIAGRWRASELNIATGASTGATYISTGFIFTFPAMYILYYNEAYAIGTNSDGSLQFLITEIPSLAVPLVATIVSGFLGILYFIIFRRVWLVEDPLHVPGIEANLQLLEIAETTAKSGLSQAKEAIKLITISTALTMVFTFFKDLKAPSWGWEETLFDTWFQGKIYVDGGLWIPREWTTDHLNTWLGFTLYPLQFGIGWFMKFKVAFLVSMGGLLAWFVIIPLALYFEVPTYNNAAGGFIALSTYGEDAPIVAFAEIARIMGIGAILGGGLTALAKNAKTFKTATSDLWAMKKQREEGGDEEMGYDGNNDSRSKGYIEGKGWYEWPIHHIPPMLVITAISIFILFAIEFSPLYAVIISLMLVSTTFFLGAIAVKVMGETGTEPVSGTSFLVLLGLVGFFKLVGASNEEIAVMSIIGTTVFGGSISMSGDIVFDFKAGLYLGNRPFHLMKGEMTGIIPGAIVSVMGAAFFGYGIGTGKLDLQAPQAYAFAKVLQVLLGGVTVDFIIRIIFIGIAIGVLAELTTGMGTAFGLGMYLPLSITMPLLAGGACRDLWETKWLEPRAEKFGWGDRRKIMERLKTYMLATGLIVGEAIAGTIVALILMASA